MSVTVDLIPCFKQEEDCFFFTEGNKIVSYSGFNSLLHRRRYVRERFKNRETSLFVGETEDGFRVRMGEFYLKIDSRTDKRIIKKSQFTLRKSRTL